MYCSAAHCRLQFRKFHIVCYFNNQNFIINRENFLKINAKNIVELLVFLIYVNWSCFDYLQGLGIYCLSNFFCLETVRVKNVLWKIFWGNFGERLRENVWSFNQGNPCCWTTAWWQISFFILPVFHAIFFYFFNVLTGINNSIQNVNRKTWTCGLKLKCWKMFRLSNDLNERIFLRILVSKMSYIPKIYKILLNPGTF